MCVCVRVCVCVCVCMCVCVHAPHVYLPGPVAHKQLFLQEGVVDTALDALRQSTFAHIQFKALSILRLLVDKQGEQAATGGPTYLAKLTLSRNILLSLLS